MSRTIVIGDLHGCYDETVELLSQLAVTSSDRVIFAGDLVDRGPQPAECVELAMKHEAVLGNHEEKHLQQRKRLRRQQALGPGAALADGVNADHYKTFSALNDAHYDYFASLPLFIRLPEFNAAVVHAGVFPGVPLEKQSAHHLLHIQCINPPATKSYWPSKAPVDHTFWTNHYTGPERIIYGHSVLEKPLMTEWAVGVDTGAVFGGGLTALVLPEWQFVSVKSRNFGTRRNKVALYEAQNGVRMYS